MTDIQQKQPANLLDDQMKKKIPDMLNVLTILTFIGCGLFSILSLVGFVGAQANYDKLLSLQGTLPDNTPDFAKKLVGPEALELSRRSLENRLPLLLLALVGYVLCLYGAIQMRKLKKVGFSIYVIGQVAPIAGTLIFIGTGAMIGMWMAIGLIFPAVFIILYATQLKHLS